MSKARPLIRPAAFHKGFEPKPAWAVLNSGVISRFVYSSYSSRDSLVLDFVWFNPELLRDCQTLGLAPVTAFLSNTS
jgi:hypothetical protein